MAWKTPKTNWQAADVVSKDDFNRIEGNIQELQNTKETPAGAQAEAEAAAGAVQAELNTHKADKANPHGTTKAQIELGNVDNVKQMPISGGTFTGIAKAQSNTSYTTRQLRNVIMSTANPSGGSNGDIWIKYK